MVIYVGNLAYTVCEEDLKRLFEKFGAVEKVRIMNDSETGQIRGWGFVTMAEEASGKKAVQALNLKPFKGRKIKVNSYRPRPRGKGPKFGQWNPY